MASDRLRGNTTSKKIILDTSAILMIFEFTVDLEKELTRLVGKYHIFVPKQVVEELRILSEKGDGVKQRYANASLKLVEKYEKIDVEAINADDAVLKLAKKVDGIIVSNDRELRNRAKELSIHTVFLREKSKLSYE